MKKFIQIFLITILFSPSNTNAQGLVNKPKRNELGFELGGTGILYNVYYQQKMFNLGVKSTFNLRIGGAAVPLFLFSNGGNPKLGYTVNLTPTALFFNKRHAWEAGFGVCLFDYTERNAEYMLNGKSTKTNLYDRFIMLAPQIGYRYYFYNQRFYLKGSLQLHAVIKRWDYFGYSNDLFMRPWAGLSAGITL